MAQDHLTAAITESKIDSAPDSSVVLLKKFLASNPSVKFIRYQSVDLSSIVRLRIAPVDFALKTVTSDAEVSVPSPWGSAALLDDTLLYEIVQAARDGLKPDWSSLKVCQYEPRHAVVMCYIREGGTQHQNGFKRCPRTCLQEMVSMAKNKHDLEFLVGFEIEFYVFDDSKGQPAPIPTIPSVMTTSSLRNRYLPMLEEMVLLLEKAGISVHYFHSEGGGPGFFEISTAPLPPLEAVDSLIYSQETIKTVCSKNGLRATMHPFPFDKLSPAGQHMHISLSRKDSATADAFLEGLLERMPSLFAFGMPNYDSYARAEMMEYACWGTENRSCVVRKIRDAHWEIRFPDGTSNGYLTVASILAAGLDSVERGAPLTVKDKLHFRRLIEEAERQELGITISLPTSLKAALKALEEDEVLKGRLGKDLTDRYLFVKRKEEEKFASLTIAERRELTMRNL
ncbi:hypothetical protein BGW37DRAFT_548945 [Umbelopsis sp. PMI_123]|nr:hypothetical protein BGW37DRAFT_548945 [Umbelopsis sp. PMI_123]